MEEANQIIKAIKKHQKSLKGLKKALGTEEDVPIDIVLTLFEQLDYSQETNLFLLKKL